MRKQNICVWNAIVILLTMTTLISCATIMGKSGPETLALRSTPDQATVVIIDEEGTKIFEGKTPTTVSLEKKKGYFRGKKYNIKIAKPGYAEQSVVVDTRLNGWYIGGNLLFGVVGWLIVDPATGAMWSLDTNELNVNLESSQRTKLMESYQLGVILLEDVPRFLKDKMVKVSP